MQKNWEFCQVGVVVEDMDRAIKYYEDLGIGPFEARKVPPPQDRVVHGKPAPDIKVVSMHAQLGPGIRLELVQPISGESLQKEFLQRHGEGINHIAFYVDDLDKEVTELVKKGFKVIQSVRRPGSQSTAYFDTDKVGGVLIELTQQS